MADHERRDDAKSDLYRRWVKVRVAAIHKVVSAEEVLSQNGVVLRYDGHRAEQISCPFHGADEHPSARFHPSDGDGPAGVWCFVCNKRWDAIGLWKNFRQFEGSFGSLLRTMEKVYGLTPPEIAPEVVEEENADEADLGKLLEACENRLRYGRKACSMQLFLGLSSIVERIYYQIEHGTIIPSAAKRLLRKVLDKVGERERACLVG